MKIERIDDKTVKCFLSNEELEEYEIDYKDFILRNDKAKQVVHDIIVQAAEQVGYKPPQFAFDMQIMMLPDQGLLLTFSESDATEVMHGREILEYLREVKKALLKTREELGMIVESAASGRTDAEDARAESAETTDKPQTAIFVFDGIRQVMEYARVLPGNLRVSSTLYEMDGRYYLFVGKGSASHERYSRACIRAMEFGYLHSADETGLSILQEHGDCLIGEKALQKLRG
ncbi:MAG: adaptor protein MecA [Clostridium sp.]|nr:adaptor protein MecA [Acetatifactor muris]MCM1527528.1 adaptor protein MecA [Bacteroides sp.]MCM1563770.1 adaptor protein MecA [Clostridium sp.]